MIAYACFRFIFSTLPAIKAMKRPKSAARHKAMRKPVISDNHPMTGGPTKKPKKLMLATTVMAKLALMVPNLPAIL